MQNNKKLKICHVASVGITVRFLLMPQLKFLISQGFDVSVVCSPGKLKEEIEKEGVKAKEITIKRKLFSPISDGIALLQLFFYFKKEKFDIVHTHAPKPALLGQLAAKMAGVPVIVNTIHGLYFTENSPWLKRKVFIFIEKISALYSTLIFSQNGEDMATMLKEKIAKPGKITYLGNGIDMQRFNPEKFSQEFITGKKRDLGIAENVKIVGTVGRLVKEKGYFDLFEAMKIVLKKYPNVLLLVIGPEDSDKKDRFSSRIVEEFGIENNVTFLGERQDVDQLYPLMDVFAFASHREGFPRSVIEAMAMERAIIATNIRGCREQINDQVHGLVIPPGNPPALANAIMYLLEKPDKAHQMAQEAKVRAQKEFDEHLVFERLNQEYSRLIKERIR